MGDAVKAPDSPVRAGFRRDRTHRLAALLAFALSLATAVLAVWPAWQWWSSALALAPRADVLVDRIDLVVLKELVQFDRSSTFGLAGAAVTSGLVLALLLNPLVGAGVAGLVTGAPAGRGVTQFFETGIRFYGRSLRALVYVGLAGFVVVSLAWSIGVIASEALGDRGLERATIVAGILRFVIVGLIAAFFTAVLDLARIRLVRRDGRHVAAACVDALRFAVRRLGALARIGLVYAACLAAVSAMAWLLRINLPGGGWGWLALAVLLQQAVVYARLRLRVSVIASLAALGDQWSAPPPPVAADDELRFAEYDRLFEDEPAPRDTPVSVGGSR